MRIRILFYVSCLFFAFSAGVIVTVFFISPSTDSIDIADNTEKSEIVDIVTPSDVPHKQEEAITHQAAVLNNSGRTPDEEINIRIYGLRNKAVVNINTEILAYNWFFEPIVQDGGVGSGAIIDKKGHILTNYHVVKNANKLIVTLWNGNQLEGTLIGYDLENDLAVIKVDAGPFLLDVIPFGDSSQLQVGQKVLAIGNPFALDRTLTTGIVSGLGRPIKTDDNIVIQNMIQTDAAINPGNSGGPLLNDRGELIGINTIIISPTRGSVGVGFAIPSKTVVRVVNDILKYGKVQRGWISWQVQPLFPDLVRYARLSIDEGLLITAVENNSNASKSNIRGGSKNKAVRYGRTIIYLGGDIVTKINTTEVNSIATLLEALEQTQPGEKVDVEYYRGRRKLTTTVVLEPRPENLRF